MPVVDPIHRAKIVNAFWAMLIEHIVMVVGTGMVVGVLTILWLSIASRRDSREWLASKGGEFATGGKREAAEAVISEIRGQGHGEYRNRFVGLQRAIVLGGAVVAFLLTVATLVIAIVMP